ncbi:hypothetical protein [Chryseobacterium sp. 3008163]|uniref:hypothetical protein n=1 Tax=Chryseobacterium sp. 3008163 TaxID=2478663 RepID=UPI000F0C83F1|nr:hypothetical protein [Chryseobacterium sp. 3008163]AYM99221.1 hypothetical protein EAG08_01685 [Chryseobacterium sp. 3008163]
MKEFLSEYPLYRNYLLVEDFKLGNEHYYDPSEFKDITFKYFCEYEEEETVFNLSLDRGNHFNTYSYENRIADFLFKNNKLDYTFLTEGLCQSCRKYKIDFLLHVYSDNPISDILKNERNITLSSQSAIPGVVSNLFIEKVGINPEQKFIINKNVKKFLDKESNVFILKV